MNALLIALGLMVALTSASTTVPAEIQQVSTTTAPLTIDEMIQTSADKHGVDGKVMRQVLMCESTLNPKAEGDHGINGTATTSWGIAQIHLPAHPEITKEQALDPKFAINWTAKEMAAGRGYMWTCYRKLYSIGL